MLLHQFLLNMKFLQLLIQNKSLHDVLQIHRRLFGVLFLLFLSYLVYLLFYSLLYFLLRLRLLVHTHMFHLYSSISIRFVLRHMLHVNYLLFLYLLIFQLHIMWILLVLHNSYHNMELQLLLSLFLNLHLLLLLPCFVHMYLLFQHHMHLQRSYSL